MGAAIDTLGAVGGIGGKGGNKVAIALLSAFLIFITLRGELSDYLNILRGVKKPTGGEGFSIGGISVPTAGGGAISVPSITIPKVGDIVGGIYKPSKSDYEDILGQIDNWEKKNPNATKGLPPVQYPDLKLAPLQPLKPLF